MELALIAAVARNGVIGRDNGLVWHEPLTRSTSGPSRWAARS